MRIARLAWPTTLMKPRWPRALTRSTQKPFSVLGKVTRSTRARQDPRRARRGYPCHAAVMEINAWVRYQDQLGSANAIKLEVVITARALSADGAVALVSRRRSIALGRKISPNSPGDLAMRSIRLA